MRSFKLFQRSDHEQDKVSQCAPLSPEMVEYNDIAYKVCMESASIFESFGQNYFIQPPGLNMS